MPPPASPPSAPDQQVDSRLNSSTANKVADVQDEQPRIHGSLADPHIECYQRLDPFHRDRERNDESASPAQEQYYTRTETLSKSEASVAELAQALPESPDTTASTPHIADVKQRVTNLRAARSAVQVVQAHQQRTVSPTCWQSSEAVSPKAAARAEHQHLRNASPPTDAVNRREGSSSPDDYVEQSLLHCIVIKAIRQKRRGPLSRRSLHHTVRSVQVRGQRSPSEISPLRPCRTGRPTILRALVPMTRLKAKTQSSTKCDMRRKLSRSEQSTVR